MMTATAARSRASWRADSPAAYTGAAEAGAGSISVRASAPSAFSRAPTAYLTANLPLSAATMVARPPSPTALARSTSTTSPTLSWPQMGQSTRAAVQSVDSIGLESGRTTQ